MVWIRPPVAVDEGTRAQPYSRGQTEKRPISPVPLYTRSRRSLVLMLSTAPARRCVPADEMRVTSPRVRTNFVRSVRGFAGLFLRATPATLRTRTHARTQTNPGNLYPRSVQIGKALSTQRLAKVGSIRDGGTRFARSRGQFRALIKYCRT